MIKPGKEVNAESWVGIGGGGGQYGDRAQKLAVRDLFIPSTLLVLSVLTGMFDSRVKSFQRRSNKTNLPKKDFDE